MIRPVLAVFAGLLCGLIGQRQARRIREEGANLSRWEQLLRRLALLLREGTLSLPEALVQSAGEDSAPALMLRRLGGELAEHPLSSLPELYAWAASAGPEAPVLSRLMAQLGRGSLESRCQAAEQAAEEIALLARAATERAATDAKLHASLGWTCGACLTILLL